LPEVPPTRVRGEECLRNALLVIDEVGYRQLSRQEASLFFRLVSWRYHKGSTLITTNKVPGETLLEGAAQRAAAKRGVEEVAHDGEAEERRLASRIVGGHVVLRVGLGPMAGRSSMSRRGSADILC
jgi:hypothetical protein